MPERGQDAGGRRHDRAVDGPAAGGDAVLRWLLLAALPVFFLYLGANSIWDANEAFYVETPRQMVRTGDYLTPVFNGAFRLNKPVLSYWIVAGLYHLFGISVTVERAGIALGAMAIVLAAVLIGRALRSATTGVLAGLIVATAPRMVMFSRRIFIDVYITAFMALTLACFVQAERHPRHRRRYLLLMYGAMGLGVLTKGPVAIVLPMLVAGLWVAWERRWSDLRGLLIGPGLVLVLLIVAPWYVALVQHHGWGPVTGFLIGENLERYTSALAPEGRSVWFYLPVLFGDLFPWAPLLVLPMIAPLVGAWRRPDPAAPAVHTSIRRLLWLWIAVFMAVFSLSQTKQDLYIFPVVPAVAALVADLLVGTRFGAAHRGVKAGLVLVAGVVVACGLLLPRLFASGYYALPGTPIAAVVLMAGGVVILGALALGRERIAVIGLAGTFVAFNYVFVTALLPGVERLKPVVPLARVITERAEPAARVGGYRMMLPSLVYYADRVVENMEEPDQAVAFFQDPRGGWALMSETEFDELRTLVPGVCVAARSPRLEAKLDDILAQQPPPDVLLVTNRCTAEPGR